MENKKLIEKYTVTSDKVPATVCIWDKFEENVPIYEILMPSISDASEALLSELRDELAANVPVEVEDATDQEKIIEMKSKFIKDTKKILNRELPEHAENKIDILAGIILHRMFGLGFVDLMMSDNFLEELGINGSRQPISVYHKKYGWCKTTITLDSEEEVYNLSSQIGRKVGREINNLNPLMDAHLLTGDRVASTLFPISTSGNTITIRRFARNPWTIIHLIDPKNGTLNKEIAAFLWQAMQYELNVLVAGGTASGKTSILSAISGLIPPNQRIISIEDTREISLPNVLHWNWIPMTTRIPNPEGKGEITMLDLMISSLRMRPDRVVVGEVRRKDQAETMFEAMHTGHSVYATLHADTVSQVKRRLIEPPLAIPKNEVESLQLVLVQFRDRRKGMRRTLELAEILSESEGDLAINYLYRWIPRTDKFEKANNSIRIVEELNLHTGMTESDMMDDLKEKEQILQWMLDNNIRDIDDVGLVMKMYYKNNKYLLDVIKSRKSPHLILKKSLPDSVGGRKGLSLANGAKKGGLLAKKVT